MIDLSIKEFLGKLGSAAPGSRRRAARRRWGGALCAALCSMVAALTSGKKKYAQYQEDIDRSARETAEITETMENLIEKDAEAFEPLSKAYGFRRRIPTASGLWKKRSESPVLPPSKFYARPADLFLFWKNWRLRAPGLSSATSGYLRQPAPWRCAARR